MRETIKYLPYLLLLLSVVIIFFFIKVALPGVNRDFAGILTICLLLILPAINLVLSLKIIKSKKTISAPAFWLNLAAFLLAVIITDYFTFIHVFFIAYYFLGMTVTIVWVKK